MFDAEKKEYTGMLDMLDLTTFALVTFEDRKLLYEREFLQFGSGDLVNKPEYNAHLISNMSTRNRLVSVRPNTPLAELIGHFSAESGAHRVCVMDEHQKLLGLISQTDLIRFLSERDFKELAKLHVGEWAVKKLITCKPTTEASKGDKKKEGKDGKDFDKKKKKKNVAFELLIDHHVSALPIVDDAGHLISSFSASDLKGAEPGKLFASLQESVVLFLKHTEQRLRPGVPGRRVLTAKLGDDLLEVMTKLIAQKVHRIWIVNAKSVVIGVVSLSDIFSQLNKK